MDKVWLISKIVAVGPPLILAVYLLNWIIGWVFGSPAGPVTRNDFAAFWVASSQALAGKSAAVYDFSQFQTALSAVAGKELYTPWFYPPIFLLLILPLSLFPYYTSMAVWLGLSLGAYLLAVRRIAPHPLTLWLALAFPGALVNLNYGQNGLLSTALLGGGLVLLERSPVAAGVLLGVLSYKPNMAVLIPLALIAGRYWRALGTAVITTGALALASGLVLGWDAWAAFWNIRHLPMQALAQGVAPLNYMTTTFAAVIMAGGSLPAAYLLQGMVAVIALGAVTWVWWRPAPMAIRVSVLTLGTLLFTPFAAEYELARLAIPLAWIGWAGYRKGWQPGDKLYLFLGWVTPFISRVMALTDTIQITPLILLFLLSLNLVRRRVSQSESSMAPRTFSPGDAGDH